MNDELEQRLTLELGERVPEPPALCTAQDVWDRDESLQNRSNGVGTRITAVIAVAVVVLAVALTATLWNGTRHEKRSEPGRPHDPVISNPAALIGPTWTLEQIERSGGHVTEVRPRDTATIKFSRFRQDLVLQTQDCDTATATAKPGRITFDEGFLNDLVAGVSCGHRIPVAEAEFLYRRVLTGSIGWSISGDTLVMSKSGVATLSFRAIRADATITGRLLVVGGPASPRQSAGSITLQQLPGYPVRTATLSSGRFSVGVTPGRFMVTGRSFLTNQLQCSATHDVSARAHHTTTINVYCSIP